MFSAKIFFHLEYLDYCLCCYCHIHNILAYVSLNLLQVFHVELGTPHRTSNQIMEVDSSNFVNHDWVQMFSYSKYCYLPVGGIEPTASKKKKKERKLQEAEV